MSQSRTGLQLLVDQDSLEKYIKKLIGDTDIEDSLQRLDRLTQEEAKMAAAELLKITRNVEGRVQDVGSDVKNVGKMVQGVNHKIQGINKEVKDVGDRVLSVDGKLDDINRSLSLHPPSRRSGGLDSFKETSSAIIFFGGSRLQTLPPTITLHTKLVMMVQLNGSFKVVYSRNGRPPVPSYGYTGSVSFSKLHFALSVLIILVFVAGSGKSVLRFVLSRLVLPYLTHMMNSAPRSFKI